MAISREHMEDLVARFAASQLNETELQEFLQLLQDETITEPLGASIENALTRSEYASALTIEQRQLLLDKIERRMNTPTPVHRIHFLKTAWFKYAAAIIIILGSGAYLWNTQQKEKPSVTKINPLPVQNDVAPGGNRATLTLADGRKIVLDSAADGIVASDGNVSIKKINNNIIYPSLREGSGVGSSEIAYNTMSTPRGGQYQLTLPDGSQVWLNAESSITYPTAFTGKTRDVSVSGEAYFEVAKNKSKPFIVSVKKEKGIPSVREGSVAGPGDLTIEVLGTHFNVNAYKDEATINTTLLEGSVRLTPHASRPTNVHTSLILKPGQQAIVDSETQVVKNVDVQPVIAWKNGNFYFDNRDLRSILADFSRWYDVYVEYEGQLKNRTFFGIVKRDKPLSHVLKLLHDNNIKFRIKGKKLIVQSD